MYPIWAITLALIQLSALGHAAENQASPLQITSSFTIPSEWVQRIMPQGVKHTCLVPANSELHGFQLSPQAVRQLSQSALVVGLNPDLEPWLAAWAKANRQEAKVVWIDLGEGGKAMKNPHGWTDPLHVKKMVETLERELKRRFPHLVSYHAINQLFKEINAVDSELNSLFQELPKDRRALVTQHPNLDPFAGRYGLQIPTTLLNSALAESADPSARHYSELLATIRREKIRLIISDEGQNDSLARRLCADAGLPPPLGLSFEFLTSNDPTKDSWSRMILRNGRKIHAALRDQ